MSTLIVYLLATLVSLGIFYSAYYMLLRKEPLFVFNRVYLISALGLSIIIPLLIFIPGELIPGLIKSSPGNILYSFNLAPVQITGSTGNHLVAVDLIRLGYVAGLVFFILRLCIRLTTIYKLVSKSEQSIHDQANIRWSKADIPPFSFFGTIYLPVNLRKDPHVNEIIRHEQVHVKSGHSFDIMLTQTLQAIFWFNPFIPLIEKALRELHEFEADKEIINSGTDPVIYTRLLFSQDKTAQAILLGNNFNYSLIKRRLTMFYKKSTRFAKLKAIVIMPAAICAVMIYTLGCQQSTNNSATALKLSDSNIMPPPPPPPPPAGNNDESGVFTVVENMPQFPGGSEALIDYMRKNVKYPEAAKKKGVQGIVVVSFIVEKDGSIGDSKILKAVGNGFDQEAMRVVNEMPKWKPGTQNGKTVRVQFTLPVSFKLK